MQQMGERSLERDRAAFASALKKKTEEEAKNNELTWYEKESFGFAISLSVDCCCELSQTLLKKSEFRAAMQLALSCSPSSFCFHLAGLTPVSRFILPFLQFFRPPSVRFM
jgi:hypothetical protein